MEMSPEINELVAAMARAQAKMAAALKSSENPHFRSKYADYTSVRDAALPALNSEALAVFQFPRCGSNESGFFVEVETVITHATGQFMRDTLTIPVSKPDAQGVGSAIQYGRRYALGSIVGVGAEDDDGNAAVGPGPLKTKTSFTKASDIQPKGYQSWLDDLTVVADEGTAALEDAWRKSPVEHRAYLKASSAETIDKLKAKAQRAAVAQ